MGLSLATAPAIEPVTLDEARNHLRVGGGVDTAIITALIGTARRHAETVTRRALISQTWDYYIDKFVKCIYLPLPPVQSITSVKYLDTSGVLQTLANTEYTTDVITEPARIVEAFGKVWPAEQNIINAVVIRFVTGYGALTTDVPEGIRQAILMLIGHWYENRQPLGPFTKEIPMSVDSLLWPYRVLEF